MGRRQQAERAYMQKDLKISRHINCSSSPSKLFPHISRDILTLDLSDIDDVTLYAKFQTICDFIELNYGRAKGVLIYSDHGVIRSAVVVMAYIIYCYLSSYNDAYRFIKGCCPKVCLENKFKPQLLKWVEDVKTNPFAIRRYQKSTEPNLLKLPIIDQSKVPQSSFMYTHEHHPEASLHSYRHSRARKSTDATYKNLKASERLIWDIKYSVSNLGSKENAYCPSVTSSACSLVKVGRIDREKDNMEVDPGIKFKFLERKKKIERQKQKLKEKKRKLKAERRQLMEEATKMKEIEKEQSISESRERMASVTESQSPIEAVYSPLPPTKEDGLLDLLAEHEKGAEKEEKAEEEEGGDEDEEEEEEK
ncbi:hypothetical protein HELRODRAFT_188158 [Helobdella robusta]|uniref:Tyrosine-protein phosphatase domain-containing protein n=1 Tax=Helobdella robusta TaxID=6412 RepID=T1FPQ1_HELRO|nr:hypothetical protein HELRODRAFT_188158 [Helobdella robusta]ESO13208.1 hypothetical protein HELRODRAFT_188158 [Helobdella robusta]